MAIFHLSVKTISRSAGRSATGAAAYRAGEKIVDERTGEIHDYTRKRGVVSTDLVIPEDAPEWAQDREKLWNAAEFKERNQNGSWKEKATVAREFEVALPHELSKEDRRALALGFAQELVENYGFAADVCIHEPSRKGDDKNHHAHILVSTRNLTANGLDKKTRELDDKKTNAIDHWRKAWADRVNEKLKEKGIDARVDHRSLKAQGIDREPQNLPLAAIGFERRTGQKSDRRNDIEEINARLKKMADEGKAERAAELGKEDPLTNLKKIAAERAVEKAEDKAAERPEPQKLITEMSGAEFSSFAAEREEQRRREANTRSQAEIPTRELPKFLETKDLATATGKDEGQRAVFEASRDDLYGDLVRLDREADAWADALDLRSEARAREADELEQELHEREMQRKREELDQQKQKERDYEFDR